VDCRLWEMCAVSLIIQYFCPFIRSSTSVPPSDPASQGKTKVVSSITTKLTWQVASFFPIVSQKDKVHMIDTEKGSIFPR
jgi:hypothetical protein